MNKQFLMNKGIAYILYTDAKYAESAIAHMHEAHLDGAQINVSIVLPRRRFSRTPSPKAPPPDRFGEPRRFRDGPPTRGLPDRGYGRPPPPRASPGYRVGGRRPSPRFAGRGAGYRDRYEERGVYRPRSISPSRSPPRRWGKTTYDGRYRSPSYSRSPPPRRRDYSPHRGGGRRRSPSYSSYGSRRSRSRSRSRDRVGRRR